MSPTEYQQLVEFLGQRFTEIDRRFDQIDGRFDQIDGRFAQNDGRFVQIDGRFALIEGRLDQVDDRFVHIDGRFAEMARGFDGLDARLTEMRREMLQHFDETYRRLERLEQENQAITQALRRIEAGLADDRRRREILERDLAELKRHVALLQSRIEEIEQRL